MNTFTVIAYNVPVGGHHVETLTAASATEAALQLRGDLGLTHAELEIIAVAEGEVKFALLDASLVALAPYSPASP